MVASGWFEERRSVGVLSLSEMDQIIINGKTKKKFNT